MWYLSVDALCFMRLCNDIVKKTRCNTEQNPFEFLPFYYLNPRCFYIKWYGATREEKHHLLNHKSRIQFRKKSTDWTWHLLLQRSCSRLWHPWVGTQAVPWAIATSSSWPWICRVPLYSPPLTSLFRTASSSWSEFLVTNIHHGNSLHRKAIQIHQQFYVHRH